MSQATIHLTLKGNLNESEFYLIKEYDRYFLATGLDSASPLRFELSRDEDSGLFHLDTYDAFEEEQDIVESRLVGLSEEWVTMQGQGVDAETETNSTEETKPGYGPDDIFVENKPFSLKQIIDLIQSGDIEMSPNFQRHFVWDKTRQSRLIESIFLGLPLPSIYLSQYGDGRLTVVDGLQRLHTIRDFMDGSLILTNLEYLTECNGKSYHQLENVLSPLRLRRFGQTQIMCFVIDYRSPNQLKFDLFRRLNTGGKPLNNQEIRNCLSRPHLQKALHEMVKSPAFLQATDKSIKDTRMEDQEIALRFMFFYEQYDERRPVGKYNGNIDSTLDSYVDELNGRSDFNEITQAFETGLLSAQRLFGRYAFRKVFDPDYTSRKRSQINKLLMTTITVLLAKNATRYRSGIDRGIDLTPTLARLFTENLDFFNAVTWSTNSKANIVLVYNQLKNLFDTNLLQLGEQDA